MKNANENVVAVKYKDLMLAKQKEYYRKNKENIRKKGRIKRINMKEEEKQKLREKEKRKRENMSHERKQQLKEYLRNYNKNRYHNHIAYVKT